MIATGASQLLAWSLSRARNQTLSLVAPVPADRMWTQAASGEHHAAWILGHLLLGDVYLLYLLGSRELPADLPGLLATYGPGATPTANPDRYHPKVTLVDRLSRTGTGHHVHALACHEGYHAGQLSAWCKTHGLGTAAWAFAAADGSGAQGSLNAG